jgi:hypothetical protein
MTFPITWLSGPSRRARLGTVGLGAALAIHGSGCASPASNLRIDAVAAGHGAFFGRINVRNEGRGVTKHCYVEFTDAAAKRKIYTSLDNTGWVFSEVGNGPTYLSRVTCTLGGFIKYNAEYQTRKFYFNVRGGSEIAYFGDIQIEMNSSGTGATEGAVFGGAVGTLLATAGEGGNGSLYVDVQFEEAVREYRARYGATASALAPRIAVPTELIPAKHAVTRADATSKPEFDREMAARTLGDAALTASQCGTAGGPSGEGRARVTFLTSGGVGSIEFEAPFAGSLVEDCLRHAFAWAKVNPYSGEPVTASKRFSLASKP